MKGRVKLNYEKIHSIIKERGLYDYKQWTDIVSPVTFYNIISKADKKYNISIVFKIAEKLGVDVEDIIVE